MDQDRSALGHAFQLARSGQVSNVEDISKKAGNEEGYDARDMFVGPSLRSPIEGAS